VAAVVLLLATAGLTGCGSPAVQPPDIDLSLPDRWTGAAEQTAALDWWESFPGDAPREYVAEALAGNWNLAAAAARLDAAHAETGIAGSPLYPALSAGANAARQQQVFVGLPIPGQTEPLTSRSTSYGVSLDLSWEVDLWGRLRQASSAAAASAEATAADYQGARLSLAGQTLKAWFAATEAELQLDVAERNAVAFRRTEENITALYREGVRPSIDVRLAKVDVAEADVAVEQRRLARDRAVRAMELVLGRYPGASLQPGDDLPAAPAAVPAGLSVDLLTRRPDLVAAERRLAAAGRRVSESRRARLPRLTLTGSAGTTSNELGDLLDGDFSVWRIAAGLLQPVFQGGRLMAQVDRAQAAEDEAVAGWANSVLRACSETEAALVAEDAYARQEAAARIAAEQAAAALDLARSRYESGLDDVTALLSAQRADAAAKSRLLQIRRLRLDARVDLHLALGGGFRLPAGADAEDEEGGTS
jgi:NodT family efflux transporter outer membrane factor (OMF) lipoprotein